METTSFAQVLASHHTNGELDRTAGMPIMTRAAYKDAYPGMCPEDLDDLYRAYRHGYRFI